MGDALGFEVEFMSLSLICLKFGDKGITRYVLHNGVAEFSDDTQMSLFTAEGLLNATVAKDTLDISAVNQGIKEAYINWYITQTTKVPHSSPNSWMSNLKTLWSRRAPGLTCINSLESIMGGFPARNHSKGCGGVMRVAPIGIYFAAHPSLQGLEAPVTVASNAALITHGHTASSYASALLAAIVCSLITCDSPITTAALKACIEDGMNHAYAHIPSNGCWHEFEKLISRALVLAESSVTDSEAIRQLGEGWVADEAVAIAIFSVMRHIDSFEDCIVCAVNHDGDSDSTGAIAGNIIGAIHGYSAIPKHFLDNLEIEPVLVSVADDLCADHPSQRMKDRYVRHLPADADSKHLI